MYISICEKKVFALDSYKWSVEVFSSHNNREVRPFSTWQPVTQIRNIISVTDCSYLDIPIFIKVVYARDASSVTVGVVHMSYVARSIPRVTCNHGLTKAEWERGWLQRHKLGGDRRMWKSQIKSARMMGRQRSTESIFNSVAQSVFWNL